MSAANRVLLVALTALALGGCVTSITFLSPNLKLRIVSVNADPVTIHTDGSSLLTVATDNPAGGKLTYSWSAHQGTVTSAGDSARYYGANCCLGSDLIAVTVKNEKGETDTRTLRMTVLDP
jgi:hypothetical protein